MHRIDHLARLLATPAPRRTILGLLAAAFAHRPATAQCAPGDPGCACADTEPYCGDGYGCRGDGICVVSCAINACPTGYHCDTDQLCYGDLLTPCNSSDDCSVELGLVCRTCPPEGGCTGTACLEDDYCERAEDCDTANCYECVASACMYACGEQESCDGEGQCQPVIICTEAEGACADDAECCAGLVCERVCVPACSGDDVCSDGAICCDGHCAVQECCAGVLEHSCADGEICFEGTCVPVCFADIDCVDGEICCEGVCAPIACCMADEAEKRRCPEGTACFEGYCDPVCDSDKDCDKGTCCCPDGSCSSECCGGKKDDKVEFPETGVGPNGAAGAVIAFGAVAVATSMLGKTIAPRNNPS